MHGGRSVQICASTTSTTGSYAQCDAGLAATDTVMVYMCSIWGVSLPATRAKLAYTKLHLGGVT